MDEASTVAQRVAYLAEHAGVDPTTLSLYAGLGPSHVRQLAAGKIAEPTTGTLVALARVCGATSEWIILGRGRAPDPDAVRERVAVVALGYGAAAKRAAGGR